MSAFDFVNLHTNEWEHELTMKLWEFGVKISLCKHISFSSYPEVIPGYKEKHYQGVLGLPQRLTGNSPALPPEQALAH